MFARSDAKRYQVWNEYATLSCFLFLITDLPRGFSSLAPCWVSNTLWPIWSLPDRPRHPETCKWRQEWQLIVNEKHCKRNSRCDGGLMKQGCCGPCVLAPVESLLLMQGGKEAETETSRSPQIQCCHLGVVIGITLFSMNCLTWILFWLDVDTYCKRCHPKLCNIAFN